MNNTGRFEVGDRVVGVAKESGFDIRGMTGTVVLRRDSHADYAVEFDDPVPGGGHTCDGHTQPGHGLWCWPRNIALVEEEPWDLDLETVAALL